MKYLFDPNCVTNFPFNMITDTLATLCNKYFFNNDFTFLRNIELPLNINRNSLKVFDGIDINFTISALFSGYWNQPRKNMIKKLKGLPIFAFHGGHENLSKQFEYMDINLADNTKRIKYNICQQLSVVRYLAVNENPIIVFHPGYIDNFNLNMNYPIYNNNEFFSSTLKNLEFAVKKAEDLDIIIALENMPFSENGYYIGSDYRDLKYILKKIPSPNLKICFDWGHANNYAIKYAGYNNKNDDYIKNFAYHSEIIDELGKDIVYSHLHYNRSHELSNLSETGDEHLPFTRIPKHDYVIYERIIKKLLEKTSIAKHGLIYQELFPEKVFAFYPFWKNGCKNNESIESLNILKSMVSNDFVR